MVKGKKDLIKKKKLGEITLSTHYKIYKLNIEFYGRKYILYVMEET